MAAVVTINRSHQLEAGWWIYQGTIAMDNSYPTGGEPIDVAANTLFDILMAQPEQGYVFEFDKANQKLLAYRQKDPAAAGGADIALPQVANAADLSALTAIDFIAYGA